VVIIYADDMGWGDVGYHGVKDILTPNTDKLAAEGVSFSQGYVSASVCGPSRCGLMTGVYQQRLGCGENPNTKGFPEDPKFPFAGLPTSQPILSEMLKPLGYRCGMVGKWHLGLHETMRPNARGFDYYYGFLNGAHSYEKALPEFGKKKDVWPLFRNNEMEPPYEGYLTDTFTDEAVAFIERCATANRESQISEPFFLYVAYNAVHAPWQVPDKYRERTKHLSDIEDRCFFAAMVLAMDDGVGRIMAALDKTGVDDDTLVFFISDNGTPRGQGLAHPKKDYTRERGGCTMSSAGPFRGFKGDTFEGGIRVPFAMRWPGRIKPGTKYDKPITNLDVVPTVMAHLGVGQPGRGLPFDGVDLMPYLAGKSGDARPHDVLYWRRDDDYAVRKGDWKLAWNDHSVPPGSDAMLFNLAEDPGEHHDLSAKHPRLKQELQDLFDEWDSPLPPSRCWGGPNNRRPKDAAKMVVLGEEAGDWSVLEPGDAKVHGKVVRRRPDVISHWREPGEWIEWSFTPSVSGAHEIIVEYSGPNATALAVELGKVRLTANLRSRRDWGDHGAALAGTTRLEAGRKVRLALRQGESWRAVNIRRVVVRPSAVEPDRQPNIILMMADDLGVECLGSYGCTEYQTPGLDQLAREGMRFTHCYAQPLCTPSRVQIMTGRYNNRNYDGFGVLRRSEITFGNMLRDAGYRTCVAGKWQLAGDKDTPNHFGFDEYCLWFLYPPAKEKAGQAQGRRYWEPYRFWENGNMKTVARDAYGPDLFCSYIEGFIARQHENPFFIYFPMALTHAPFEPTPDTRHATPADRQFSQHKYKDDRHMKDMVAYMDRIVGRIRVSLAKHGVAENTIILFTGDNGTDKRVTTETNDGPVQGGKGDMTDGGTHVPLVALYPGRMPAGTVSDALIDFSDFMPTFAEAAGAKLPTDRVIDGVSFLPLLRGEKGNPREWVFCHYWGFGRRRADASSFARTQRYKAYDDGRFYDLQSDPGEQTPLKHRVLDDDARRVKAKLKQVIAETMK